MAAGERSGPRISTTNDEEVRTRLAAVIVEALEIGTFKHERDVVSELFAAFGVDAAEFSPGPRRFGRPSTQELRDAAAEQLCQAAPSAAELLNELMRCGGRFVDMINAIYDRLRRHAAHVLGDAERFRLRRADVDETGLEISTAFVEEVKRLERILADVQLSRLDERAISTFVLSDMGELYGQLPPAVRHRQRIELDMLPTETGDRQFADAVLHLGWLAASEDGQRNPAVAAAVSAADRLVGAAEQLVGDYLTYLDGLGEVDPERLPRGPFINDVSGPNFLREVQRYRDLGVLGLIAYPDRVTGMDEISIVGLDRGREAVFVPARADDVLNGDGFLPGTGMSELAGFVAMWRSRMWASRRRVDLQERLQDPGELAEWLGEVTADADAGARWLTDDVALPFATVQVPQVLSAVEQYLNLPLWKKRSLLYEVWVLCAILEAAEATGRSTELVGFAGNSWTLPSRGGSDPVARLHGQGSAAPLDVWREPQRRPVSGGDPITPDFIVSSAGEFARDLLIVEAKDRSPVLARRSSWVNLMKRPPKESDTGLHWARKYAVGLLPRATWVCNHCAFVDDPESGKNFGDPWNPVYFASAFRPRSVLPEFTESVRAALAPIPPLQGASDRTPLTILLDVTSSMQRSATTRWATLADAATRWSFGQLRAVLYSDHGKNEPFLVRKIGPFGDFAELASAVASQPTGNGGDVPEALEDALQRCREIAEDIGPHVLLVITDAPPHPSADCPYGIDLSVEVSALFALGCRMWVATDWRRPLGPEWLAFADDPRFRSGPLAELLGGG